MVVARGPDRRSETRDAAPDHEGVGEDLREERRPEGDEVASLIEEWIHRVPCLWLTVRGLLMISGSLTR